MGRTYARDVDPVIVLVAPEHADLLTDEFGRYSRDYDVRCVGTTDDADALISAVLGEGGRVPLIVSESLLPDADTYEAKHPAARTHPETGEKSIYVSRAHTTHFDGMTEEESRPLIEYLQAHATRQEFTCRVRWEPGTLTVWDNRVTQHSAINDYHGQRRRMRRLTVGAQVPV